MSLANSTYIVGRRIQDAQWLTPAFALPGGASTTVTSGTLDLDGGSARTDLAEAPSDVDAFFQLPALSTTILPDTRTYTITLLGGDTTTPATQIGEAYVVTGAGGAGAPAQEFHWRFAPGAHRYFAFQVASGASTTTGAALNGQGGIGF